MKILEEQYDVIVIGAGGGGLRSAVGAAQKGAKTLLICKGKVNRSGATLLAGANISADIACDGETLDKLGISHDNPEDTREDWFFDTVHEGFFLNDQRLVELFVDTAGDRVGEMVEWGMKVRGMEGERGISVFGSDILDTLYARAKKVGVNFMQDTQFTDLLMSGGAVCGVICVDVITGEMIAVRSKAVVLATGGAHNMFGLNSGSTDLCGEGQAAAMRAGAQMIDMEMISFCPTVTSYPTMYKGNILPYILFSTGYGRVVNKHGKTFTHRYLSPAVERLALDTEWNKMLLSYAFNAEMQSGRGVHRDGLYYCMDLSPAEILEELYMDLPSLDKGIYADIMDVFKSGRSLVIRPAAHYFEGGIKISTDMSTNIPGLYAAGECTGGLFGANRVSAATTEMMVEGAVAGEQAAAYAAANAMAEPDAAWIEGVECELLAPFAGKDGATPAELMKELHAITGETMNVIRTEKKLTGGLERLKALKQAMENVCVDGTDRVYNRPWRQYMQLRSMIPVAEATLTSALLRKESRGVHVRGDALYTDNTEFLKGIVIDGRSGTASFEPTAMTRLKPEMGRFTYVDYIEKVVARVQREERA